MDFETGRELEMAFKNGDRVVLEYDRKYAGKIVAALGKPYPGDEDLFDVQWDKDGRYHYIASALISEEEAKKQVEESKKKDKK